MCEGKASCWVLPQGQECVRSLHTRMCLSGHSPWVSCSWSHLLKGGMVRARTCTGCCVLCGGQGSHARSLVSSPPAPPVGDSDGTYLVWPPWMTLLTGAGTAWGSCWRGTLHDDPLPHPGEGPPDPAHCPPGWCGQSCPPRCSRGWGSSGRCQPLLRRRLWWPWHMPAAVLNFEAHLLLGVPVALSGHGGHRRPRSST